MTNLSTLLVSSVFIFNVSLHKYLAVTEGKPTLSDSPVSLPLQEQDSPTGSYSIAGSKDWVLLPTSADTYAVGHMDPGANTHQFVYASTSGSAGLSTTHTMPECAFEPAQWMILQTVDDIANQTITLNEAATSYAKPALTKAKVDVTLVRKFNAGRWNSFCLPFDMTAKQVTRLWGAATQVAEFTRVTEHEDNIVATFDITDGSIQGGRPCLLFIPHEATRLDNTYTLTDIDATTWQRDAKPTTVNRQGLSYAGSYDKTMVPYGSYVFTGDDKLHHVETTTLSMKGFRAYLIHGEGGESLAKPLSISLDGDTPTSIDRLPIPACSSPTDIFHIDGTLARRHTTSTRGLAPGVYLMDGKKIVVK